MHVACFSLTVQCPTLQLCVQIMYDVYNNVFAPLLFNCLMVQIMSCLVPHPLVRTELPNCKQENLPHDVHFNLIVFVSYA